MYDRGATTEDTSGRRARPYCAAPRAVAVSASEGRAMTLTRPPNRSWTQEITLGIFLPVV